jgi:hypothetical protein
MKEAEFMIKEFVYKHSQCIEALKMTNKLVETDRHI